jgi:hypothetical protein
MTDKKAYPLRINEAVLAAMQRWAEDDLRSLNAQIEYVLREALRKSGRLKAPGADEARPPASQAVQEPTDAAAMDGRGGGAGAPAREPR